MGRDFSVRSTDAERMDAVGLDYEVMRDCLADLARVNRLTLAHRPTLAYLDRLWRAGRLNPGRPLEIVDLGSGRGDLLAAIAAWAERRRLPVSLTGIDLNPWSARAAAEAWPGRSQPRWITGDFFDLRPEADVIVTSLVTHHLNDDQIVRLLAWMQTAGRIGWFVNDLHRHPVAFHGFRALATFMGWHPFVRHDGPVSIARAFTVVEWRAYGARAGLDPKSIDIRRRFPFRICVSRSGPGP